MPPEHPALTAEEVISRGGWHPRYARVLAIANDGDYGFALIDGNGDGSELEAETWTWEDGAWTGAGSSGAGPLDNLGPVQSGGKIGNAHFAYSHAPTRQMITISFDGGLHKTPVSRYGVWAFIKIRANPQGSGYPTPMA